MKHEKPIFTWNEEKGETVCLLKCNKVNKSFIGKAFCSEADKDMQTQRVGEIIAYQRAKIEFYKYQLEIEKAKLQGLRQLYYSIKHSQKYNEKSYESKMLKKQIAIREDEICFYKFMIRNEIGSLKTFIKDKEQFYQRIRKNRLDKNN